MVARGKTLVPLLVVVAVVASQSTLVQVKPEESGELLWGTVVGLGAAADRQGGEGEPSHVLSLPPRAAENGPIFR